MNAGAIFLLAQYAHSQLEPLMDSVGGELELVLGFGSYAAIQVWAFPKYPAGGSLAHRTGIKTKDQVDELVAEVKALASVAA